LFASVLLAISSSAWSQDITYNIVDYPANETDFSNGEQDSISGTIITDGNTGALSPSDILGGSFTLSNPSCGAVTAPITVTGPQVEFSGLTATPSELCLLPGTGVFTFTTAFFSKVGVGSIYLGCQYCDASASDAGDTVSIFGVGYQNLTYAYGFSEGSFPSATFPATPGNIGSCGADWVIAGNGQPTPEPATLALLGSALLGLAVVYLRRRGAKA
jgi:hypothetical protein